MIWWFLILGISTLIVVCVAIALMMRLRRHLQASPEPPDGQSTALDVEAGPGNLES